MRTPFNESIFNTYDENGNKATMTAPDGGVTTYGYDSMDRFLNFTDPMGDTTSYEYDEMGRRIKVIYPNGVYSNVTYDEASRLLGIHYYDSSDSRVVEYEYQQDGVGNIVNKTENGTEYTVYVYDDVYRLTNVTYPDEDYTGFTYDAVGNRLTKYGSTWLRNYTYDEDNRLLSQKYTSGAITQWTNYTYDNNGNTITYGQYDHENRLVKYQGGGTEINYTYSADGKRLSRETSTDTVYYLYDGQQVLYEMNGTGDMQANYTYGPGMDEPVKMVRGGSSYYYVADHLGSITKMADSSEGIVADYGYSAFGYLESEAGSVTNPYRFTGREWDSDEGLYYYRARTYQSLDGRFLQKDPAEFVDGPNVYQYAVGNPVNGKDPTGEKVSIEGCNWRHKNAIEYNLEAIAKDIRTVYPFYRLVCGWLWCRWEKYKVVNDRCRDGVIKWGGYKGDRGSLWKGHRIVHDMYNYLSGIYDITIECVSQNSDECKSGSDGKEVLGAYDKYLNRIYLCSRAFGRGKLRIPIAHEIAHAADVWKQTPHNYANRHDDPAYQIGYACEV